MEGYTLKRRVRELLAETSGGTFMNDRTTYDCLYDAVKDFNKRTHFSTSNQTISVVAGTAAYDLNPDFVELALMSGHNQPYIKHTDSGGNDNFIYGQPYQNVVLENNESTASVPESFSIVDASPNARISGTVTSVGAATNGECTLTDSGADFTDVSVGDFVHNTTDDSHGIVLAKTSNTALVCALFEGTTNDWEASDNYMIIPQARYQMIFTPTPSASATVTVNYHQRPAPVYAPYRSYNLPSDAELPICSFAAFLYKYRDREPNFGDALFQHYDRFTRKAAAEMRRGVPKGGFRVNFTKMSKRSTGGR